MTNDSCRNVIMNSIGGIIVLVAFALHPFFGLLAAALWVVGAAVARAEVGSPLAERERLEETRRLLASRKPPPPRASASEMAHDFRIAMWGVAVIVTLYAAIVLTAAAHAP